MVPSTFFIHRMKCGMKGLIAIKETKLPLIEEEVKSISLPYAS